jgi:hypothetical protein
MKATSIGGKGDTRKVASSVGVVLLWLRVLVVAALLIGAAHAQTLVTQPTTTTLWVGSQDTTRPLNFILGSVSASQGTCSSSGNAITCNLGTVNAPLRFVTVNFNVGPAAGTFTTTDSATFAGTDTNPANNTLNVTIQPK